MAGHIRRANEGDITLLADLIRCSFRDVANRFKITPENCPTHPSNCTYEWVENSLKKGTEFYILSEDAVPVGCVALERASRDVYYMERLAVLPEFRDHGYGRALVDYCFSQARLRMAKRVEAGIIADQIELVEWYRRLGFRFKQRARFHNLPFPVAFMYHNLATEV
ncbi:GNAT family N-acetyltransferase [candidate division KSB1 bacterium]|nr:GNAT family N-acetyltransferase [candidate division KSB1 bacterium]RQW04825.1 MAG: GNAT family N-acetyltransferase [candidate division KSB1 bacterium]